MKNSIKFLVVLLVLLGCEKIPLLSSGSGSGKYYSSKVINGVKVELDIKKEKITDLHDIEAEFKLTNISKKQVTYSFSSGCQSGYKIKRNDDVIFDSTKNLLCTMALTNIILKPEESKTIPISLESRDNKELAKGIYTLKAFLLDSNGVEISASFEAQ